MPFIFLAPVFIPRESMTTWLGTATMYNPVTYLLEALRSLIMVGWDLTALAQGIAAVAGVAIFSISLAMWTLKGRLTRS